MDPRVLTVVTVAGNAPIDDIMAALIEGLRNPECPRIRRGGDICNKLFLCGTWAENVVWKITTRFVGKGMTIMITDATVDDQEILRDLFADDPIAH